MTAAAAGAPAPDPDLTLAVERTLDAPRSAVWRFSSAAWMCM